MVGRVSFAYRVGTPGKIGRRWRYCGYRSGGEMTIAVSSPELDVYLAGTRALELLAQRIGRSIF